MYQDFLKDGFESTSDEMMDDPITEVRGKYLTLYWISYDKCGARSESIRSRLDLFPELDAFQLIVQLEFESSIGISLVPATVIVGFEDVGERKHDNLEKDERPFADRKRSGKAKSRLNQSDPAP